MESAFARLRAGYLDNTEIKLTRMANWNVISMSGPEPYYEHPIFRIYEELPEPIKQKPRVVRQLQKMGSANISPRLARQLRLHDLLVARVGMNLAYALLASLTRRTSFLTDKEIHIQFLRSLGGNIDEEKVNKIAQEHLTTIVPFLGDIQLSDLVTLRKKEGDSFVQFRATSNRSINEFVRMGKTVTKVEARQIYADMIAPELARLEKTVKQARRSILKNIGTSAVGVLGAISFGLLSGLVSPEFTRIAQAIGLTKFSADVVSNLASVKSAEDSIQRDNFYFLWKVRHLSR